MKSWAKSCSLLNLERKRAGGVEKRCSGLRTEESQLLSLSLHISGSNRIIIF